MPRFFVSPENIQGRRFLLSGSEAHHAAIVLRKQIGDEIELFDGKDRSFRGRIERLTASEIQGEILESSLGRLIPVAIWLYQGLIRGPRWDWLLQKACEVGVARVIPVESLRSVIKLNSRDIPSKLERWRRIASEASKQSGRQTIMAVDPPQPFTTVLKSGAELALMPWEKATEKRIAEACTGFSGLSVALYIGPEGGWDGAEVTLARAAGITPVRLGPTLLRSETAGVVAATLVLAQLGVY